mmetsp:Transcript_7595/g.9651  ORF Transcript_7595/g.9651 Transcript_7595/m.9651 type:complete len:385 (-) Transcript_7595:811-1965(-)|eukprot:CAMPEP_0204836998 /NCGR_PEP_ID=MMETSP1346-20131115/26851_1 /ASSEMBLY_ACC=CAM_ASM_000771 /TAXON_ID=215587 /ORGANISM="Aplanochytrium stocchinoi, Strain GSBS06" /LENGTH=384 /DNA_ID=CAMNT_0051972183 /DNA_START=121 /DNA_END=1275 /DNA_ORIENTATION=-
MAVKKGEKIDSLKAELRAKRENITLLRAPLTTLYLFTVVVLDYTKYLITNSLKSSITHFLVLPLVGLYAGLKYTGDFADEVGLVDFWVSYVVWWFGLGVLSSIGLGSGMHSGILFLFPHIFRIVTASKICGHMDFESSCDMWWQECDMHCITPSTDTESEFVAVLARTMLPAMLWGAGTATGEIPPYLVSRAAALSGQMDEETMEMLEETKGNDAFSKMKAWMVDFVEKYGFWGVLLMSAWPNAAFDLVGICCGQLNVSFMTFYVATMIGKAFIKVNGQAVFFVVWFRNPEVVMDFAAKTVESFDFLPISGDDVRAKLEVAYKSVTQGQMKEGDEGWVKFIGEKVVIAFILMFLVSTIQQFAQQRQKMYDDQKLEKLTKEKKCE